MSHTQAVILGIVQGLTEFLPVSSSGHLVLFQNLLGMKEPMIAFDIAVHWGTLTAVFIYFYREIYRLITDPFIVVFKFFTAAPKAELFLRYPYAKVGLFILTATVPTGIIGIVFKDPLQAAFASLKLVAIAWFCTGILLVLSKNFQTGQKKLPEIGFLRAAGIGVAQGIAIIPGVSRSGSTIFTGMILGLEKKEAARFSFLMGIPAILGAGILESKDCLAELQTQWSVFAAGFMTSAVVGIFAIALLLKLTQKGKFHLFGYYCIAISLIALTSIFFTS